MAIPEYPSRHSLIPSFIYSSSLKPLSTANLDQYLMQSMDNPSGHSDSHPTPPPTAEMRPKFMIPAPAEKRIAMFSPAYYAACTAGGIFSCGLTHMAVTPLDLVKCNMQVLSLSLSLPLVFFLLFFLCLPIGLGLIFVCFELLI